MNTPQNPTPMDGMAIGDLVNLTLSEHDSYEVLRVHGGWLYTRMSVTHSKIIGGEPTDNLIGTTAFVPEPPKKGPLYEFTPGEIKPFTQGEGVQIVQPPLDPNTPR